MLTSPPAGFDAITDYNYDDNGNLKLDNNKDISSITYNYLNLPAVIITAKGTITYTYDASGNKLKKTTLENSATVSYLGTNYTGNITTVSTYANGAVDESKIYSNGTLNTNLGYTDKLQFLPQEEGRIRYIPATGSTPEYLAYDYFIKDHLGNVRMVLTDELKTDMYPPASMEVAQAAVEEQLYANLNTTRSTLPAGYPTDTYTDPNVRVAKVSAAPGSQLAFIRMKKANPVITNLLSPVFLGDRITYSVRYFSKYLSV